MQVAVFADAHAHADALDAVIASAVARGAQEFWSLVDGDSVSVQRFTLL